MSCSAVAFAGQTTGTSDLDRQIAEEEKNIAALNDRYEQILKQKQEIDERLRRQVLDPAGQSDPVQARQEAARPEPAPVETVKRVPVETVRQAAVPVEAAKPAPVVTEDPRKTASIAALRKEEADFRRRLKTEEEKAREEERLRKLRVAEDMKQERQCRRMEDEKRREEARFENERRKEEARLESERRKIDAARRVAARRMALEQQKADAEQEKEQRKLAAFLKQRQAQEQRQQQELLRGRKQEIQTLGPAAAVSPEPAKPLSPVQRQKKVSTVLDSIEKIDSWVQGNLW